LSGIHQGHCYRIDVEGCGLNSLSRKGHRKRKPHMSTSAHDAIGDRRNRVPGQRLNSVSV
jgi:hypothetical protein